MSSWPSAQPTCDPIKAFPEPFPSEGAGRLYTPLALLDFVELKHFCDFSRRHRVGKVLLVGKDEKDGVLNVGVGEEFL